MLQNNNKITLIGLVNFGNIPLALYYLKSFTDKYLDHKFNTTILEPYDENYIEEISNEIQNNPPAIVGFSCYIWNYHETVKAAQAIKEISPETLVIVGGPEIGVDPTKILKENECIDYAIAGEGEVTFKELLEFLSNSSNDHEKRRSIQGLCFRHEGNIYENAKREVIQDLDIIPSPYTTGAIDLSKEPRGILYETYRGCPFECTFCYYPKDYGRKLHSFSIERIESDIKEILQYNIKELYLMDPTFNIPVDRAKKILRIIAKYNKDRNLNVTTEVRVDFLDEETIELLPKANIHAVEAGIQSTNPKTLEMVKRKQSFKKYQDSIRILKKNNIAFVSQLIYGLPRDSLEDVKKSIDHSFIHLNADRLLFMRLQLLPGTSMYRDAQLLGLEFVDSPPRVINSTPTMSLKEIELCENLEVELRMFNDHNSFLKLVTRFIPYYLDIRIFDFVNNFMTYIDKDRAIAKKKISVIFTKWNYIIQGSSKSDIFQFLEKQNLPLFEFLRELTSEDHVIKLAEDYLRYSFQIAQMNRDFSHLESDLLPKKYIHLIEFHHDIFEELEDNIVIDIESDEIKPLPELRKTYAVFYPKKDYTVYRHYNGGQFDKIYQGKKISKDMFDQLKSEENLAISFLDQL